jgi:hypothetical protein
MTRNQADLVSITQCVMRNRYPDSWLLTGGGQSIAQETVQEVAPLIEATPEDILKAVAELQQRYKPIAHRTDEMADFDADMEADEAADYA